VSVVAARRLAVRHETRYDYDAPVEVARHTALAAPARDRTPAGAAVAADDRSRARRAGAVHARTPSATGGWDSATRRVHEWLAVVSSFEVEVSAPPPLQREPSPPWEEVAQLLRYRAGRQQPGAVEFMLGTPFRAARCAPGAAWARICSRRDGRCSTAVLALMDRVHARLVYRPRTTDVATSALQALALGQGVCQDFAHLMIGSLRSSGLAARYVSGYLLTRPPPGEPRLLGADASHAWVAVLVPAPRLGRARSYQQRRRRRRPRHARLGSRTMPTSHR